MNGTIKFISAFVIGAGVGSIVTWKFVKRKYEQLADDEIAQMREYYENHYKKNQDEEQPVKEAATDEKDDDTLWPVPITATEAERVEYSNISKKLGYISEEDKGGDSVVNKNRPYVIPPEEFDEVDGYATESLTYYADGVLADSNDEIIDNVEELIGEDSLNHFGEYEDDSVFVRNDEQQCDYEILRDLRNYSDAKRSHYMEG